MGKHILPGNPPVEISLRQSAAARRISLRVSRLDGRVTLTLPRGVSEREGIDFARQKADWLRGHLTTRPETVVVGLGGQILFEGKPLTLVPGTGRSPRIVDTTLCIPGPPDRAGARAVGFLKLAARDRLAAASDHYATALGLPYATLSLRDTRSRWGSCSSNGTLMYSWRLIMAPPPVLRYVVAHEVAHLAEMNHSAAFWAVVKRLYGPYETPRNWLRAHGETLHRYRFGD